MIYLDTNVIVYAIENHPKYGEACKNILLEIESEKRKACASMLVLVEVINVLVKINKILDTKKLDVSKNIDAILSLPIVWFDLNFLVVKRATEYDYNISGVDYVHLASMEINSIKQIISADEELDKVDFIKRIDPLMYA